MSVNLSITLKIFKFLTLFVALVGTIDAGVSCGISIQYLSQIQGFRTPAQTGEM